MTREAIPVELKSMGHKQKNEMFLKLLPLTLTVAVILCDQLSKQLIINNISPNDLSAGYWFFGDFLRIIHVRNPGVAFSLGHTLSTNVRHILFGFAPLIVIVWAFVVYFRNNTFNSLQRWAICGIIGGGFGNLYDRFFRTEGVVDFIDVKFYGLFGLERWPTFNIADAVILICGFTLVISFLRATIKE